MWWRVLEIDDPLGGRVREGDICPETGRPGIRILLVFSFLRMILEGKTNFTHHCSLDVQHRVAT